MENFRKKIFFFEISFLFSKNSPNLFSNSFPAGIRIFLEIERKKPKTQIYLAKNGLWRHSRRHCRYKITIFISRLFQTFLYQLPSDTFSKFKFLQLSIDFSLITPGTRLKRKAHQF